MSIPAEKQEEVKSLLSFLEQETNSVELKSSIELIEPKREIGETIACSAKDDHGLTRARIIPNMSHSSNDGQKWLYISQGQRHNVVGISITLKSLKEIVQWAITSANAKE